MRALALVVGLLALSGCLDGGNEEPDDPPPSFSWPSHEVSAPARVTIEGEMLTTLASDVHLPQGATDAPTILIHTPYADSLLSSSFDIGFAVDELAPRGFAVVVAHARGTGASGGCNDYYGPQEQRDGLTWVNWIVEQEWSNGQVFAFGHSYAGGTAIALATANPIELAGAISLSGMSSVYEDLAPGGTWRINSVTEPATYIAIETLINDPNGAPGTGTCSVPPTPTTGFVGIRDDYYQARDWTRHAATTTTPMILLHGFEDTNVGYAQMSDFAMNLKGDHITVSGPWTHSDYLDQSWVTEAILGWLAPRVHEPAPDMEYSGVPGIVHRPWPTTDAMELAWNGTGFGGPGAHEDSWAIGGTGAGVTLSLDLPEDTEVAGRVEVSFAASWVEPGTVFFVDLGCARGGYNTLYSADQTMPSMTPIGSMERISVQIEPILGATDACSHVQISTGRGAQATPSNVGGQPIATVTSTDASPLLLTFPTV